MSDLPAKASVFDGGEAGGHHIGWPLLRYSLHNRLGHYLLLLTVAGCLFLPNLGAPSLWDIDEGHNAEAAREMLESGNWLVPTFNFQLRDHKPPLLYWLQMAAYRYFGINEFAARLPSALAGLAGVLITYELGRRMFGVGTGLFAGLVLASAAMFTASAHFANPDALLDALSLLTLFLFWRGFTGNHRGWFIPAAVCMGLAVLTKGPVGLLPAGVIGLFLLWSGRLHLLWDRRLFPAIFAFLVVAVPWYAWVTAETKGEFTRGFFLTHNVGRFLSPMENHHGPIYYYLIALGLGFVPWSAFLPAAVWYSLKSETAKERNGETVREWLGLGEKEATNHTNQHEFCYSWLFVRFVALFFRSAPATPRRPFPVSAFRFLACWIAVYFLFFSLAGTKLPNYILPVYPAVAILTARFLSDWLRELIQPPAWVIGLSLGLFALVGVAVGFGLILVGGVVNLSILRGRHLPGMEVWAGMGTVLVFGAVLAWWLARRDLRRAMVGSLLVAAVLFTLPLAAWGTIQVDAFKASRPLVQEAHACQTDRDIRIGCYRFYQPSLVFYCRREVKVLNDESQVLEFLQSPLPVYLFIPAKAWETLASKAPVSSHVLASHPDLYKGYEVVVITNK
jgi:4-amino-4-deoxy-L-arabinose transferase-like glycosyltransferase